MRNVRLRTLAVAVAAGALVAAAPGVASATSSGGKTADGVARSGVKCGPGVRQVTWSDYAAPCVPEFSGKNGGATAHGVTGDTITVVYRKQAGLGDAQQGYIDLAQTFIDFFNKNYELYGRKVQLKTFDGQGSGIAELTGQGQAQAQADAQTAYDLGAFASPESLTTTVFQDALVAHKIISVGSGFVSSKHLKDSAPFLYANGVYLSAENYGRAAARVACARMHDLPATFSGTESDHTRKRVFGLIAPEDPHLQPAADVFEKEAKARCGLEVAQRSALPIDIAGASAKSAPVIAQMKDAGVTTVIEMSLLAQSFLMSAATKQDYSPEWLVPPADVNGKDKSQADHAIQIDVFGATPVQESLESYKAFKLADPNGNVPDGWLGATAFDQLNQAYWAVLNLFNAFQAAGPNLTPSTFKKGWFSLPPVAHGSFGAWKFGKNSQNMLADYTLSNWDSTVTDPNTGEQGAFVACNNGDRYPISTKDVGSGQLDCFGG